MLCPFCSHSDDRVVDSRESRGGLATRRRRECLKCKRRFTTYERIEEVHYFVVKKEGHRERFLRSKIQRGLLRACEKRPVSSQQLEELVDLVEQKVVYAPDHEITSREIGEVVMNQLRKLDKVAYIRFASVYLDFKNIREFMDVISKLAKTH